VARAPQDRRGWVAPACGRADGRAAAAVWAAVCRWAAAAGGRRQRGTVGGSGRQCGGR
jgi:hypothetical protein